MKNVKMQCVDLHDGGENPIHCPLCGVKIAMGCSEEDVNEWIVGKCEHFLFAAVDAIAFEYRSERFDRAVEAAMSKKTDREREERRRSRKTMFRSYWRLSRYRMRSCSNRS